MSYVFETEKYAVISTIHIEPTTAAKLTGFPIVCEEMAHRFRIGHIAGIDDKAALPDDLRGVIDCVRAIDPECYGIMIDSDGPEVPGLARYDW